MALIDTALGADPSNGELWLYKVTSRLVRQRKLGSVSFDALRNSYFAAPIEGWIAAERVILGLRLYPVLPEDLQALVDRDLRLVLKSGQLAQRLIEAYASDSSLRAAATVPLRALPADLMSRFVKRIYSVIRR